MNQKPQTILTSYQIYKQLKRKYNICQEHLSALISMVNDFNYGLLKMDSLVTIDKKPKSVATWFVMFEIKVKRTDEIDNLLNKILEETNKEPIMKTFFEGLNPNKGKKDSDDADKFDQERDFNNSF